LPLNCPSCNHGLKWGELSPEQREALLSLIPAKHIRAQSARLMNRDKTDFFVGAVVQSHEDAVANGRKGALAKLAKMRRPGGRMKQTNN
jgi:hypothetical protein